MLTTISTPGKEGPNIKKLLKCMMHSSLLARHLLTVPITLAVIFVVWQAKILPRSCAQKTSTKKVPGFHIETDCSACVTRGKVNDVFALFHWSPLESSWSQNSYYFRVL